MDDASLVDNRRGRDEHIGEHEGVADAGVVAASVISDIEQEGFCVLHSGGDGCGVVAWLEGAQTETGKF